MSRTKRQERKKKMMQETKNTRSVSATGRNANSPRSGSRHQEKYQIDVPRGGHSVLQSRHARSDVAIAAPRAVHEWHPLKQLRSHRR